MEDKKEAEIEIQKEESPKVSELVGLDFPLPLVRPGKGKGETESEAGVCGGERGAQEQVQVLWCLFLSGH